MEKLSDSQRLEQLYELYEQKMYAVAFSILHNEWQAEDAVQDAFIRLLKNINKLKDNDSRESRTYVLRTIKAAAIDQYRKNSSENKQCTPIMDMEIEDKKDDITDVVSNITNKMMLDHILSSLAKQYREVVVYRCLYQLSVKETAAVLEIGESVVRKRQQRAMKKIKDMIGDEKYEYTRI